MQNDIGHIFGVHRHQLIARIRRRTLDELVDLGFSARRECPRRGCPVAGVLTHRRQEGHQIGSKVSENGEEGKGCNNSRGNPR